MLYIRGNFFIPDARKYWVKPSVAFLEDYIKKEQIQTVITTGPPHSLHLIGLKLKERIGVKWIADFRDPWTTIAYHNQLRLTKASKLKHKALEHQVLNTANQILVTSFTTKQEFQKITKQPIAVITNGYDHQSTLDFQLDSKFTVSHIGSLLSKRNPEVLWKVLRDLIQTNSDFSKDFQLNIIGYVSDTVLKTIANYQLTNYVNNIGYIPHSEVVKYQKQTQLLLLIEIDSKDTQCIIPGKLFEYMVSNRPIVALGPENSDVENIIKETNTGNYFYYTDYKLLKEVILQHYKAFKNNALESHPIGLKKYHRKELTKSLADLL